MQELSHRQKIAVSLKDLVARKESFLIKTQKGPTLLVNGELSRYTLKEGTLKELSTELDKRYSITLLKASSSELSMVRETGRPVSELLWEIAFSCPSDQLLPGCKRADVIKLQKWPNLTRLDRSDNTVRISTLLSSRPTSLDLAGKILNIDVAELFKFYNAASYAGLTSTVNRKEEAYSIPASKNLSIIRKLMTYLKPEEARY